MKNSDQPIEYFRIYWKSAKTGMWKSSPYVFTKKMAFKRVKICSRMAKTTEFKISLEPDPSITDIFKGVRV